MHELRIYFKKIHNQLEAGFNKEFKKHGLTSTQLDVLLYLSRENGRENTLSDIAAHFDVKHTSVIHVLKLLEQKGFIRKSTAAGTRSKPILLTDSGKQLGEQLILEMEQKSPLLDEIMFAGLSDGSDHVGVFGLSYEERISQIIDQYHDHTDNRWHDIADNGFRYRGIPEYFCCFIFHNKFFLSCRQISL